MPLIIWLRGARWFTRTAATQASCGFVETLTARKYLFHDANILVLMFPAACFVFPSLCPTWPNAGCNLPTSDAETLQAAGQAPSQKHDGTEPGSQVPRSVCHQVGRANLATSRDELQAYSPNVTWCDCQVWYVAAEMLLYIAEYYVDLMKLRVTKHYNKHHQNISKQWFANKHHQNSGLHLHVLFYESQPS